MELSGWICEKCGTYNDSSVNICVVCFYDRTEVIREERKKRLQRILLAAQRVFLFLIIISSFALMAYNIFEAERQGSSAAIAAERIAGFSVLHKGAETLRQRWNTVVSQIESIFGTFTHRFVFLTERVHRSNEPSAGTRAASLPAKADNIRQIAVVRFRAISIFARQSFSSAAERLSVLITQCGESVMRIYALMQ